MYTERLEVEEKKTYRHGDGFRDYPQRLKQNREELDRKFKSFVSQQKLASVGAMLEVNRMTKSKAAA
jgi:hypothetical protein